MKIQHILPTALALSLAACGGGTAGGSQAAMATYTFATPAVGAKSAMSRVTVDNMNNTLSQNYITQVTAVNADGTFVEQSYDPSNDSFSSGQVDYTLYPTTLSFNAVGQETNSVTAYSSTNSATCDFSPHAGSTPSPMSIGQTWSYNYSACSNDAAPISYSINGSLVDEETLTVPAGTFSTFKFQNTLVYANARGITVTEKSTTWHNSSPTDSRVIQQISNYSYSGGTPVQGAPVTQTRILQSFQ